MSTGEAPASGSGAVWRRVWPYFGLMFAISHGLVIAFLLAGGSFADPGWVFFAQASGLTPALVALVMTRWVWRSPLVATLALRPRFDRWLLIAWLVPWLLVLLALVLGLAFPGVSWDGSLQGAVTQRLVSEEQIQALRDVASGMGLPPVLLLVPMGLLLSVTLSLLAGCGEEIGFRGFVHTALRPLGFRRAALYTSLLWLIWHLPLLAYGYGYPAHPGLGVLLMTGHVLISGFNLAYLRERSGSALATGLFHGTTEAAALIAVAPLAGGNELTVGIGSLSWIGADLLILIGFLGHDRFVARESFFWRRAARPAGAADGRPRA